MLEVPIVRELAGFGSAIVAVVLFPITMTVVPWYSVAARGDWMPVLVTYGGVGLALAFMGAGSAVVVSHLGSNSGYGKPRRRIAFWRRSER